MIVIIDYGMGNLGSIQNILKKVGGEAEISRNLEVIAKAEKLILPGVGAFDQGMDNLRQGGFIEILTKKVVLEKVPILGICLGMQLFSRESEEGVGKGLGWVAAKTVRFHFPVESPHKIPHMGWAPILRKGNCPLFADLPQEHRFYFVHSYFVECEDQSIVAATSEHGVEFCSAIQSGNIYGVQFHPEKSHRFGMILMKNFLVLK